MFGEPVRRSILGGIFVAAVSPSVVAQPQAAVPGFSVAEIASVAGEGIESVALATIPGFGTHLYFVVDDFLPLFQGTLYRVAPEGGMPEAILPLDEFPTPIVSIEALPDTSLFAVGLWASHVQEFALGPGGIVTPQDPVDFTGLHSSQGIEYVEAGTFAGKFLISAGPIHDPGIFEFDPATATLDLIQEFSPSIGEIARLGVDTPPPGSTFGSHIYTVAWNLNFFSPIGATVYRLLSPGQEVLATLSKPAKSIAFPPASSPFGDFLYVLTAKPFCGPDDAILRIGSDGTVSEFATDFCNDLGGSEIEFSPDGTALFVAPGCSGPWGTPAKLYRIDSTATTVTKGIGGPGDLSNCDPPTNPPTLCDGMTPASAAFTFTLLDTDSGQTLALEVNNTSPVTPGVPNPLLTRIFFGSPHLAVTEMSLLSVDPPDIGVEWDWTFDPDLQDGENPNVSPGFCAFNGKLEPIGDGVGGIANPNADTISAPPGSFVVGPVTFLFEIGGPPSSGVQATSFLQAFSQIPPGDLRVNLVGEFTDGGLVSASGAMAPLPTCEPAAWIVGAPCLGCTVTLVMSGQVGCTGCLAVSPTSGPLEIPTPFGTVVIPLGFPAIPLLVGAVPGATFLTQDLSLPLQPALVGQTVHFANVLMDPQTGELFASSGVQVELESQP